MAGMSFLPGTSGPDKSAADALKPGQSALQVLTLNLPKILGAKAPTSAENMGPTVGDTGVGFEFGGNNGIGGTSGATSPQSIVMQALMRSLMGGSEMSSSSPTSEEELRKRFGLSAPPMDMGQSAPSANPSQALDATPTNALTSPQPPDVYRPTEGGMPRPA